MTSTEFLLHLDNVVAKSVFPSDFITGREMIDSLMLIKSFVKISLAG
jgi:hypothetical protein